MQLVHRMFCFKLIRVFRIELRLIIYGQVGVHILLVALVHAAKGAWFCLHAGLPCSRSYNKLRLNSLQASSSFYHLQALVAA